MRQIRSYSANFGFIALYINFIFAVRNHDDFISIFLVSLCPLFLFSISLVCADNYGISKYFYPLNFRYKFCTWDDIKYFIEVKEEYNQYNQSYSTILKNTIWFIDKKDRLRMRLKKNRTNMVKLEEVINRFEDKSEVKMYLKNPYLKRLRLRKVVPITDKSQLTDSQQKILLNLKKRKLSGENIDAIAEEMNLKNLL